jgi:hypothetical protein
LTQDNDAAMDATDRLLKACSLDDSEGEDNWTYRYWNVFDTTEFVSIVCV